MSIFQGISLSAFSIIQVQGLWSSWIFVSLSSVVVLIAIVRMLMYLFLVPGLSWRSRSQVLCVLCPSVTACAAPQSTLCSLWIRELSHMPALALTWGLWRASCCCGWVKLQAQGMRSEWICFLKSQSFRVWGSAITWGCHGNFSTYADFLAYLVLCLSVCVCSCFTLIKYVKLELILCFTLIWPICTHLSVTNWNLMT